MSGTLKPCRALRDEEAGEERTVASAASAVSSDDDDDGDEVVARTIEMEGDEPVGASTNSPIPPQKSSSPAVATVATDLTSPPIILEQPVSTPPFGTTLSVVVADVRLTPKASPKLLDDGDEQRPSSGHRSADFSLHSDSTASPIVAQRKSSGLQAATRVIEAAERLKRGISEGNLARMRSQRRLSIRGSYETISDSVNGATAPKQRIIRSALAQEKVEGRHTIVDEVGVAGIENLRRIFEACDVNGDQVLDPQECLRAMRMFGLTVHEEEMIDMFKNLKLLHRASMSWRPSARHLLGGSKAAEQHDSSDHEDSAENGDGKAKATPAVHGGGGMLALEESDESSLFSSSSLGPRQALTVDFEEFTQLITMSQGAARFRLFDSDTTSAVGGGSGNDHRVPNTDDTFAFGRNANTESQDRGLHALDFSRRVKHLLPDSNVMWMWNVVILLASLYAFCAGTATNMLNPGDESVRFFAVTTAPDVLVTVLFVADVLVRGSTAVILETGTSHRITVDDAYQLWVLYTTSFWFWIDLVSALPLRFIVLFGGDPAFTSSAIGNITNSSSSNSSASSMYPTSLGNLNSAAAGCQQDCSTQELLMRALLAARVLSHLRILKYFGHVRFFRESHLLPLTKGYVTLNFLLAQVLIALSRLMVIIHLFVVVYNSFELSGTQSTKGHAPTGALVTVEAPYVRGLYLVLYVFTTVGYGDVPPVDDSQRMFYVVLVLVGWLVNAYVIGEVVTFSQRIDISTFRQTILVELQSVLEYFEVPETLSNEILQFEMHLLSSNVLFAHSGLFHELPTDLQRSLELTARLRVIRGLPYMNDIHSSARLQLANLMIKLTYAPEEYVIYYGEIGQEMYFLTHGFVDIFSKTHEYVFTLRPGNFFGELAILSSRPVSRTASVKSVTYCEFYVLDKTEFQDVVARYPRTRRALEALAQERLRVTNATACSTQKNGAQQQDDDDDAKGAALRGTNGDGGEKQEHIIDMGYDTGVGLRGETDRAASGADEQSAMNDDDVVLSRTRRARAAPLSTCTEGSIPNRAMEDNGAVRRQQRQPHSLRNPPLESFIPTVSTLNTVRKGAQQHDDDEHHPAPSQHASAAATTGLESERDADSVKRGHRFRSSVSAFAAVASSPTALYTQSSRAAVGFAKNHADTPLLPAHSGGASLSSSRALRHSFGRVGFASSGFAPQDRSVISPSISGDVDRARRGALAMALPQFLEFSAMATDVSATRSGSRVFDTSHRLGPPTPSVVGSCSPGGMGLLPNGQSSDITPFHETESDDDAVNEVVAQLQLEIESNAQLVDALLDALQSTAGRHEPD